MLSCPPASCPQPSAVPSLSAPPLSASPHAEWDCRLLLFSPPPELPQATPIAPSPVVAGPAITCSPAVSPSPSVTVEREVTWTLRDRQLREAAVSLSSATGSSPKLATADTRPPPKPILIKPGPASSQPHTPRTTVHHAISPDEDPSTDSDSPSTDDHSSDDDPTRRVAEDGCLYTRAEFDTFYGHGPFPTPPDQVDRRGDPIPLSQYMWMEADPEKRQTEHCTMTVEPNTPMLKRNFLSLFGREAWRQACPPPAPSLPSPPAIAADAECYDQHETTPEEGAASSFPFAVHAAVAPETRRPRGRGAQSRRLENRRRVREAAAAPPIPPPPPPQLPLMQPPPMSPPVYSPEAVGEGRDPPGCRASAPPPHVPPETDELSLADVVFALTPLPPPLPDLNDLPLPKTDHAADCEASDVPSPPFPPPCEAGAFPPPPALSPHATPFTPSVSLALAVRHLPAAILPTVVSNHRQCSRCFILFDSGTYVGPHPLCMACRPSPTAALNAIAQLAIAMAPAVSMRPVPPSASSVGEGHTAAPVAPRAAPVPPLARSLPLPPSAFGRATPVPPSAGSLPMPPFTLLQNRVVSIAASHPAASLSSLSKPAAAPLPSRRRSSAAPSDVPRPSPLPLLSPVPPAMPLVGAVPLSPPTPPPPPTSLDRLARCLRTPAPPSRSPSPSSGRSLPLPSVLEWPLPSVPE